MYIYIYVYIKHAFCSVAKLFDISKYNGIYPEGESRPLSSVDTVLEFYAKRETQEEARARDREMTGLINSVREAAEVHRQVRRYAQSIIKPGIKLIDMCERIENMNRKLVGENGLKRGVGFPTGCSINHVAAHYTPNGGDNTVLKYDDVMSIDFGTQIDGRIIDCAWTVCFDPKFKPLLETVQAATEAGIKAAGIGVRLCDGGEAIEEVRGMLALLCG